MWKLSLQPSKASAMTPNQISMEGRPPCTSPLCCITPSCAFSTGGAFRDCSFGFEPLIYASPKLLMKDCYRRRDLMVDGAMAK